VWESVYTEHPDGVFHIDDISRYGYVSTSLFGEATITTDGPTGITTWEIARQGGRRNRLRIGDADNEYTFSYGAIGTNTLDLYSTAADKNILSVGGDGTYVQWFGHQHPYYDAVGDFGWVGGRWRDIHLSRHIRLSDAAGSGEMYLRNNGGVLEKSTDGSSWSAV
jgi:hypothetical protein